MADLIINGNTYQNIEYVKFKKADGTTATFYDSTRKDQRQPSANLSSKSGLAFVMLANLNLGIITASLIKED